MVDAHPPVVEHVQPHSVAGCAPPAPAVTYVALAPVVDDLALAPAVTNAEHVPVDEYCAPAPDVSYTALAPVVGYIALAPAVTYAGHALVDDYCAPAVAVSHAALAPVVEDTALAPAKIYAVPAPAVEYFGPAPAVINAAAFVAPLTPTPVRVGDTGGLRQHEWPSLRSHAHWRSCLRRPSPHPLCRGGPLPLGVGHMDTPLSLKARRQACSFHPVFSLPAQR